MSLTVNGRVKNEEWKILKAYCRGMMRTDAGRRGDWGGWFRYECWSRQAVHNGAIREGQDGVVREYQDVLRAIWSHLLENGGGKEAFDAMTVKVRTRNGRYADISKGVGMFVIGAVCVAAGLIMVGGPLGIGMIVLGVTVAAQGLKMSCMSACEDRSVQIFMGQEGNAREYVAQKS